MTSLKELLRDFSRTKVVDEPTNTTIPGATLLARLKTRIFGWLHWTDAQSRRIQLLFVLGILSTSASQQPRHIWQAAVWSSSETRLRLSYLTVITSGAGSPQQGDGVNMAAGRGGLTEILKRNGTLRCVAAETWSCCDTLPWCCEGSYLKLCGGQSNTHRLLFFSYFHFSLSGGLLPKLWPFFLSKQGLSDFLKEKHHQ